MMKFIIKFLCFEEKSAKVKDFGAKRTNESRDKEETKVLHAPASQHRKHNVAFIWYALVRPFMISRCMCFMDAQRSIMG